MIAAAVVLPVVLAILLIPKASKLDATVLDPRLHVLDYRITYGTNHLSDRSRIVGLVRRGLFQIGFHNFGYLHGPPLGELGIRTRTNAAVLFLRYGWDSMQTNGFAAEVTDDSGRVSPLQWRGWTYTTDQAGQKSAGTIAWVVEGPPGQSGDYEFRIRATTNGPVVATWKVQLRGK